MATMQRKKNIWERWIWIHLILKWENWGIKGEGAWSKDTTNDRIRTKIRVSWFPYLCFSHPTVFQMNLKSIPSSKLHSIAFSFLEPTQAFVARIPPTDLSKKNTNASSVIGLWSVSGIGFFHKSLTPVWYLSPPSHIPLYLFPHRFGFLFPRGYKYPGETMRYNNWYDNWSQRTKVGLKLYTIFWLLDLKLVI